MVLYLLSKFFDDATNEVSWSLDRCQSMLVTGFTKRLEQYDGNKCIFYDIVYKPNVNRRVSRTSTLVIFREIRIVAGNTVKENSEDFACKSLVRLPEILGWILCAKVLRSLVGWLSVCLITKV